MLTHIELMHNKPLQVLQDRMAAKLMLLEVLLTSYSFECFCT